MSKVDVPHKLYEAATESLVSDASATSTFEKMISVGYEHATIDTFKAELFATEKQIKKEFEVSSMPGPWRSAKSVIISAMILNLKLKDDNGKFYGKTALQAAIKSAKKALDADKPDPITAYYTRLYSAARQFPEGSTVQAQRDILSVGIGHLTSILNGL